MIICPSCGSSNNDDATSCNSCNSPLYSICSKCSEKNKINAITCEKCGNILESASKQVTSTNDIIGKMYDTSTVTPKITDKKNLKTAILKVFIGAVIATLTGTTNLLENQYILRFVICVAGAGIALWGLIEVSFLLIDENDANKEQQNIDLDKSFPNKKSSNMGIPVEPFKNLDNINSDSEPTKDNSIFAEVGITNTEKGNAVKETKHFESLADFLSNGIEDEINSTISILNSSPNNFASLLKLSQLYEERGELSKAIITIDKCLKQDSATAETYLYYGILQRKAGNTFAAEQAFKQSLEMNSFISKTYYQLGVLYKAKGDFQNAKVMLQKSIQLSPDDPYAHYQLGMTYNETEDYKLAIMEMMRATILHPTDSYGHSKLGQLYQKTKQYDLAISAYSRALSINSKDAFVVEKLAEVLTEKGDYEKAADLFQNALALQFQPEISTMLALGNVLRKLEHYDELGDVANEVLRLEPENDQAAFLKSISLIKQNNLEPAEKILEKLVLKPNTSYEVWIELGKIYQALGKSDKAVKATTNAPDQASIWNNIGILLSNQKAYEEAVKAFRKAISFDYTDEAISSNLRAVQARLEMNYQRIIESRKEQIKRDPEDLDLYLDMGKAYEILEMPTEALEIYKTLLEKNPQHVNGLISYAELLRKNGQLKMAMRCYREILKIEPNNTDTHLFLVQANLNLGFLNEAFNHASIAQKLAPDDPKVHFLLGKLYLAKGLAPRALKEFTSVASSVTDPDMITWAELMRRRLLRSNAN